MDEPREESEFSARTGAEHSLAINSRLRSFGREIVLRDSFGEEALLFDSLPTKLLPPHKKAYAKGFQDRYEAKRFADELRSVVKVRFTQIVRQPNYEPDPILVRWGIGVPDAPELWRPTPLPPITHKEAMGRTYTSTNLRSPLYRKTVDLGESWSPDVDRKSVV